MRKKKVLNVGLRVLKTSARVLILNIPAVIILLVLLATHKLSWISAGISLLAFWGISAIIVFYVFKDLDNFMNYLKKLAQGFEPELPKLRWGFFSSRHLTKTFLSVKNLWSNQFLSDRSVLENLTNPLLMSDNDQKIVFANFSALSLLGNKLVGQKIGDFLKDSDFLKDLKEVISKKSLSKTRAELEIKNDAGQVKTFQVKMDLLPTPTKNRATVVISFFDITPFKLFKMQQADFFANASHELKTPLAIISGCVETLQSTAQNDVKAHAQFLNLIAEQSARMTHLVQQMLQLSRMQIEVPLSDEKTFSINDLLQKTILDLTVRAQTLHKKIILKKYPHLPLFAGNRDDLYHVFLNLLDNALKYSEANSTITVSTYLDSTPKSQLVISIHNMGTPIPEDKLDRIWDKFYRLNTTDKTMEGSGLGLGIAQQIIHKYQGDIKVTSMAETGTTFTVYLPV